MSTVIITGSAGLIGSEAAVFFARQGFNVVGIDNDMRSVFFGSEASTHWQRQRLEKQLGDSYIHYDADIRDSDRIMRIFGEYAGDISLVIHAAAQPSHDWAANDPFTDFGVNANGTHNLLEATRLHCPRAVFIFTSTNKVYGDTPNRLPLIEQELRWEIDPNHTYAGGIREEMSIDQTLHSLFGASKVAADVLVQEYGRYFGMYTGIFRGGCLTGPNHSGTQLHGFLAYLMKCAATGVPYTVFGYKGKQVRDNIHSADLIAMFYEFFKAPRIAEVYNAGGGRFSNCSMLEAIDCCREITGREMNWSYSDSNRTGDHIWWVSDTGKFRRHYPGWRQKYNVPDILTEIHDTNRERWLGKAAATHASLSRQAGSGTAAINKGKKNILGININAVDYEAATGKVIAAAKAGLPMSVTALAVHGVMTGALDEVHRYRLNSFDLAVPDGQPVRWALNALYHTALPDRVYGPDLTLRICAEAAKEGLPIYFYGSRPETLDRMKENLLKKFPGLTIAGMQPSRFGQTTAEEKERIVREIRSSGAAMTFVGLGCPRQEVWAYEYRDALKMPVLAVGAAFDFHAGTLAQAPKKMQDLGLEWLFRLLMEPRRLWKRYVLLNPAYVALFLMQAARLRKFDPSDAKTPTAEMRFG